MMVHKSIAREERDPEKKKTSLRSDLRSQRAQQGGLVCL